MLSFPDKPEVKSAPPAFGQDVVVLQDCRECALKLSAANAHLSDTKSQLDALTRERDAAVAANQHTLCGREGGSVHFGSRWE
jgi:hypothetical protein